MTICESSVTFLCIITLKCQKNVNIASNYLNYSYTFFSSFSLFSTLLTVYFKVLDKLSWPW